MDTATTVVGGAEWGAVGHRRVTRVDPVTRHGWKSQWGSRDDNDNRNPARARNGTRAIRAGAARGRACDRRGCGRNGRVERARVRGAFGKGGPARPRSRRRRGVPRRALRDGDEPGRARSQHRARAGYGSSVRARSWRVTTCAAAVWCLPAPAARARDACSPASAAVMPTTPSPRSCAPASKSSHTDALRSRRGPPRFAAQSWNVFYF